MLSTRKKVIKLIFAPLIATSKATPTEATPTFICTTKATLSTPKASVSLNIVENKHVSVL